MSFTNICEYPIIWKRKGELNREREREEDKERHRQNNSMILFLPENGQDSWFTMARLSIMV